MGAAFGAVAVSASGAAPARFSETKTCGGELWFIVIRSKVTKRAQRAMAQENPGL